MQNKNNVTKKRRYNKQRSAQRTPPKIYNGAFCENN